MSILGVEQGVLAGLGDVLAELAGSLAEYGLVLVGITFGWWLSRKGR